MLTMIVIGVWHGAGWPFVIWGAYNGILLLINQAWRTVWGPSRKSLVGRLTGWALTFTVFSAGAVFFRAVDIDTSWHLISAMFGFGDGAIVDRRALDWDSWMIRQGYISDEFVRTWFGANWTVVGTLATLAAIAIALFVPDTMEITDYREGDAQSNWRRNLGRFAWRPTLPWAIVTAAIFVAVFFWIGRVSEFLYYQF
jgi:hypothetical protein